MARTSAERRAQRQYSKSNGLPKVLKLKCGGDTLKDFNQEKKGVDAEWEKTETTENNLIMDTEGQMTENANSIETLEGDVETLATEIAGHREDLVDAEGMPEMQAASMSHPKSNTWDPLEEDYRVCLLQSGVTATTFEQCNALDKVAMRKRYKDSLNRQQQIEVGGDNTFAEMTSVGYHVKTAMKPKVPRPPAVPPPRHLLQQLQAALAKRPKKMHGLRPKLGPSERMFAHCH